MNPSELMKLIKRIENNHNELVKKLDYLGKQKLPMNLANNQMMLIKDLPSYTKVYKEAKNNIELAINNLNQYIHRTNENNESLYDSIYQLNNKMSKICSEIEASIEE